jgi:hypothetical protein
MRAMSTPTTVKFQIAVPNGSGDEKVYTLTLSLLVEGCSEGDVKVTPVLANENNLSEGVLPPGEVPMLPDPPKPN